jgi:hypothetical protein
MGRIAEVVVMARMGNGDLYLRAIGADAPEPLDQAEEGLGFAPEVFQHVLHPDFADGRIRPWPRQGFEIDDLIDVAGRMAVYVDPAREDVRSTSKVQLQPGQVSASCNAYRGSLKALIGRA